MPRINESHSEFPCTEEIAQIFEGCICFSKKQRGGNKNGNSGRKERMVVWFHSMNPESPLGYKKEGLVRGEVRVPGSSIPEIVWTRLKFFRQIAVPVPVHFRASFEAGPKGRKFPSH